MALYRAPTIDEAVAWLMRQDSLEYRRRCIEHWQALVGESFAEKVKAEFLKKFKKRREQT